LIRTKRMVGRRTANWPGLVSWCRTIFCRSSVGETGVDHFVGAREQRGRHGEPTS